MLIPKFNRCKKISLIKVNIRLPVKNYTQYFLKWGSYLLKYSIILNYKRIHFTPFYFDTWGLYETIMITENQKISLANIIEWYPSLLKDCYESPIKRHAKIPNTYLETKLSVSFIIQLTSCQHNKQVEYYKLSNQTLITIAYCINY